MHDGRIGSMAPFSFRLLIAKLPAYLGSLKMALDRLTEMSIICNEIKDHYANAGYKIAGEFWETREHVVVCSLINCAVSVSTYQFTFYYLLAVYANHFNRFNPDEGFQFGGLPDG